jgi:hypothetical protein
MKRDKPSPKTVHLTFSKGGLKSNPKFYRQLISTIERDCGLKIGYRWFDNQKDIAPEQVYTNSLNAIRKSDMMIVETSISSTGVGQQLSYALQQKKPVLVCLKKSAGITNGLTFLKGTRSPHLAFVYYSTIQDLKKQLMNKLTFLNNAKLEKFNFISTKRAKDILEKESKNRGMSQSELLREIIDQWVWKNNK